MIAGSPRAIFSAQPIAHQRTLSLYDRQAVLVPDLAERARTENQLVGVQRLTEQRE